MKLYQSETERQVDYWREKYNRVVLERDELRNAKDNPWKLRQELVDLLGTEDVGEAVEKIKKLMENNTYD